MSKLRILRWEHPGGPDVITRVLPFKGRREGRVRGIGGVTPEAETGVIHFEDEGRVKVEYSGHWMLKRAREYLRASRMNHPCQHLDFSPVKLISDFLLPRQEENKLVLL